MIIETVPIDKAVGCRYDELLAGGWFRSKGIMYRSELVCMDESVHSVKHIRYAMSDYTPKKRHRKLLRQNDSQFQVTVSAVDITDDMERLYAQHCSRFKGFIHTTLADVISASCVCDSISIMQLTVHSGPELVAVSFFDVGSHSAASILCVYDLSCQKESLGIYTMLKEMEYLQGAGITYYYPGYVLHKPSCFDYKLTIGQCQWLHETKGWGAKEALDGTPSIATVLDQKMAELKVRLALNGLPSRMVYYPYFSAAYISELEPSLVKYPCYFEVIDEEHHFAATYDLEADDFVVFRPQPSVLYNMNHMLFSNDYLQSDKYEMRVMESAFYYPLEKLNSLISDLVDYQ